MRVLVLCIFCFTAFINTKGQVNLQTGSANYDIPIFSHADSKSGLSAGISLSYSSRSGLNVSDKASNVGQGWNLVAGGFVARKQNGDPDDQNSTGLFPVMPYGNSRGFNNDIAVYDMDYQSINWSGDIYSRNYVDNYFPNGFIYSEFGLEMQEMNAGGNAYTQAPRELAFLPRFRANMDKKWKLSRRALADRQQDVFVFNCNNLTGEFVIGKDGNPLLIGDSKIIITKTTNDLTGQNIRTRITEFAIKDISGILYKFGAYELSEIMKPVEISSEGPDSFRKIVTGSEPTGKYVIQRWLLTEIENPVTHEKIIFEYENYTVDFIAEKTPSYQKILGQSFESVQIYEQRSKGQLKRLKNIIFPDGHKVILEYASQPPRVDIPGELPPTQIKIQYNNEDLTLYNLTYGYFVKKDVRGYSENISESEKRFARLCLKEVQKLGNGINEPSYKFSYYTGSESADPKDIVPPFDCMAQDHWGFYNKAGIIDNDNVSPSKETLKDLIVNSTINRAPASGTAKFGLLKSVENPLGGKLSFEYEQNKSKDADNPTLEKDMGGVRVFKTTLSDGLSTINDIVTTYSYKLSDGTTSGWGYETPAYINSKQIKIWNASSVDGYTKEGVLVFDITTALAKMVIKRQVRNLANAALSTMFTLGGNAPVITTAIGSFNPVILITQIILSGLIDRLFVLFNPTDYLWTENYDFYSNQVKNPIGMNYSRVEVQNISEPGGLGKTIQEFTAPANVRSEIPSLSLPFSSKQRFPAWKYGLPSKTIVLNQAGDQLQESTRSYSFFVNSPTGTNHKSAKVELIRPESAGCWDLSYNFPVSDFSWEYYYPITGRAELVSSVKKMYSHSETLAQTEVLNTYNSDYLPKTSTTTKSNGDIISTKTYYPNDYNNISTAILELKNRNMIAVPVSTETWLTKAGGNEYLLDATINQFTVLANGEVKIEKIYKLETKQPLLKSLIGEQSPSVLIRNSTYFKEKASFIYDNSGLLLATTTPEMMVNAKVYDYSNRVVVADVENASRNDVAYSSFETAQTNGWTYNQTYVATGACVTGKKYFSFPANNQSVVISKPLLFAGLSFRLSFWSKGNALTVYNDETIISPVKTVNNPVSGWTYKEYIFSTTTIPIVYIYNYGGMTADIDEVRLYPVNARMSTVAYDPKVGKIAECDVNNRILYYEYDGLGRIKHVRDDRQNILRKYCYNYAGEVENCVDMADISPQWRWLTATSCQACPSNGFYNSGVQLRLQQDMNPQSPTYNQFRWEPYSGGSCLTAAWTITNTYCEALLVPPYGNTGYQINIYTDLNPCSATYNQTQEIRTYNPISCPPTVVCNPACNTPQYKCINGQCVQGTWQIVEVVKLGKFGPWECTWAWCYPDGTFDRPSSQVVTSSTACFVTCQ